MKINNDHYQIPTHALQISKSEYNLLYPFDKQAGVAAEMFAPFYPEISSSSHWFRIVMEVTNSCPRGKIGGGMYAVLEAFKR